MLVELVERIKSWMMLCRVATNYQRNTGPEATLLKHSSPKTECPMS